MKEKIIEVLKEVYEDGVEDTVNDDRYGFMEKYQVMYAEQIFRIFGV